MDRDVDGLVKIAESKSFFGFSKHRNKIISTKSQLLNRFDEFLPKTSLKSIYETERMLRQLLIMTRASKKLYAKSEENLYEMFLYLNELPVPRYDLDRDELTEEIMQGFKKRDQQLSAEAINSVMKIKESLRHLLGANGGEPLFNDLIASAQRQETILLELLQPQKTEGFVLLEERYNELREEFSREKAIAQRVDAHVKEVFTWSSKLSRTTWEYLDFLKSAYRRFMGWNKENQTMGGKVMGVSKYFNQHASVIALSVVGLSATMFLGGIFGAPAALLATVAEIFHIVATGGEGIQAIEEVKGIKQWAGKVLQRRVDDKAFVEELKASAG
jgi:hypothetical protein